MNILLHKTNAIITLKIYNAKVTKAPVSITIFFIASNILLELSLFIVPMCSHGFNILVDMATLKKKEDEEVNLLSKKGFPKFSQL